jgi:UMF1 family MFS transporter
MTPPADPAGETRRDRRGLWAWAFYDWANNAFFTVIMTFVFATYFAEHVAQQQRATPLSEGPGASDSVVGMSTWGFALSISGLIIALGGPVIGAVADRGGRRKPWLASFTAICAAATAALWFVKPDRLYLYLAVPLVMVAQIAADYATLFYNAMLPAIASREQLGRWSGWGWALGYGGGLGCLLIASALVWHGPDWLGLATDSLQNVRLTFVLAGVWYAGFSLPLFLLTPDEPGSGKPMPTLIREGLGQLRDTISHVRQYRDIVQFLIARMIYIDGLGTAFMFGAIYADQMFDVDKFYFGIAINITAGLGAASFAWIDDWIGSRRTILLSLAALSACGLMLVVAPGAAWFWAFGLMLGVFVGPVQAASRSYLARMAPPALRNEVFGLYALSGKATAFAGPLMVATLMSLAMQITGDAAMSRRIGMASLLVFFGGGMLLMWPLPNVTRHGEASR